MNKVLLFLSSQLSFKLLTSFIFISGGMGAWKIYENDKVLEMLAVVETRRIMRCCARVRLRKAVITSRGELVSIWKHDCQKLVRGQMHVKLRVC
jgi:hypothetical protein